MFRAVQTNTVLSVSMLSTLAEADTDEAAARQLVERLRAGFEHGTANDDIHCTASFGITYLSHFPAEFDPETLLGTLLHQADVAMMQAKAEGRNRVCVFGG